MKVDDILIDPLGNIYVVFGMPCRMTGIFLQYDANISETFAGLIYRRKDYVEESFTKIGEL